MKKSMKTVLLTTTAFAMTGMAYCPKARADSGKTLNWSVQSDLETLDPQQCVDSTSGQMLNNVCEGLYRHGTNRLEKALAKSSKVSKDGLTWTFKLRKDGRWSNGDKVTANDFVYAFQRAVNPKTNNSNANLFGPIKNAGDIQKGNKKPNELGVSAPDNYTFVVHLSAKVPYFKSLLAGYPFAPVNQNAVEKYGEKYGTAAKYTVSNGPFVMKTWTGSQQRWNLEKNSHYWDRKHVMLDKVHVMVVKEASTGYNLYQTNKLDMVTLSNQQARNLKNNPEFVTREQGRMDYLSINVNNEYLKNRNVRLALGYALNRKDMVNKVLGNGSKTPLSGVPQDFMTFKGKDFAKASHTKNATTYDKKKAQKLWNKGLKELGKSGQKVELTLLGDDDDTTKALNEYIQSAWQTTLKNLTVNVQCMPKTQRIARMMKHDFDVVYTSWGADFNDASTYLNLQARGSNYNFGQWDNDEYNKLFEASATTDAGDNQKRWNDMVKAEKLLLNDGGILPTLQPANATMLKKRVKGLVYNPVGGYNWKGVYLK